MQSSKTVDFGRPDDASHNVSWGHFPSVRPYAQSPAQVLNLLEIHGENPNGPKEKAFQGQIQHHYWH